MNFLKHLSKIFLIVFLLSTNIVRPDNQTSTLSPILINSNLPKDKQLPFGIKIEVLNFQLPVGIQNGASAIHNNKWLFIAGRINGLHGFNGSNDFPRNKQNFNVYVVDINNKTVKSRSLNDTKSGLSQAEINSLAVTAPQYYQSENTLYMTGGYTSDQSGNFSTTSKLTAINVPKLIDWVINDIQTAKDCIRQIKNPAFQVTGGVMNQAGNNPTLLMLGQNFQGQYTPSSNGIYTKQIRKFIIHDDGTNLSVNVLPSSTPNDSYRRRDINIVPVVKKINNQNNFSFVALAGVFTQTTGYWTVPIEITANGVPSMKNPDLESTFKQGMNIYKSATLQLFSSITNEMYIVLPGGITFEYFDNGTLNSDTELPFTNQMTVININKDNKYTQYFLDTSYPIIPSQGSNPGNTLLFGTGAYFMKANNLQTVENDVFNLDFVNKKETVLGYIVGGIQSTVPNTSTISDSAASPYIFKVSLTLNAIPSPILLSANSNCLGNITVTGSDANSGATITVFANNKNIGSGKANSLGNFNFNTQTKLADGKYTITVKQTTAGCTSNPSNVITVLIKKCTSSNVFIQAIIDKYVC